jgi:hypothetical protein
MMANINFQAAIADRLRAVNPAELYLQKTSPHHDNCEVTKALLVTIADTLLGMAMYLVMVWM